MGRCIRNDCLIVKQGSVTRTISVNLFFDYGMTSNCTGTLSKHGKNPLARQGPAQFTKISPRVSEICIEIKN